MSKEKVRLIMLFFAAMIVFYLLGVFVALDFNIAHWDARGRLTYGIIAPILSLWFMGILAD